MKNYILMLFCSSLCFSLSAQTDTLYMNGGVTLARVVEVTGDAVKFVYPNEELVNTIYKNNVQKIAFNNGRIQTFLESKAYKEVLSVDDFEKVIIATVEGEIKGLHKVGDVSTTAQGASTAADQERVKHRAFRILKVEAAMMGANVIYLTGPQAQGNGYTGYLSGSSSETSLTGVAYSNKMPDFDEFKQTLAGRDYFVTSERTQLKSAAWDYSTRVFMKDLYITKVTNENGITMLEADFGREKNKRFRLASFDSNGFNIFYQSRSAVYNIRILF